jgi:hypothetical protein
MRFAPQLTGAREALTRLRGFAPLAGHFWLGGVG